MLYQISNASRAFGAEVVLDNIQFGIKNNEKIALIGRNGAGKTTLLRIIAGYDEFDSGEIHKPSNLSVGYLRQNAFNDETITVRTRLNQIYEPLFKLKKELDQVGEDLKHDQSAKLVDRYARLQEQFEDQGGYTYQSEQMMVFTRFGFKEEDLNKTIDTFSGGQKTKLALVCLLLEKPDILLLDEPTNHLDLETIEWLEGYLKKYPKAVVVASHDRTFLDHIVTVVYELEFGKLTIWPGNYSAYLVAKKNDVVRQQEAYDRQQKDIERLETLIEKFRYKKNKAAFAQSKIKYLDRMEKIEAPKIDGKNFQPKFIPRLLGGKKVLEVQDLTIGYEMPLCKINLEVLRGQRIAIIGPNGQGKSTFVKTLVGLVKPLGGEFLFGHQVEIGYFDQQLAQFTGNKTVLAELWDDFPQYDRTQIRTTLGSFLFQADDVFKTVDVLSGGEKVRLSLAKLMLKQANCLIMDEPTNHLDIPGKEALEDALQDYTGTLLLVSHDRWLINKLAKAILVIDNGKATYYPLTYEEYLNKQTPVIQPEKEKVEKKEVKPVRNVNWAKQSKKLEAQIDQKEQELEDLRQLRFEPEYYQDYHKMNELNDQIDDKHNEIAHLMKSWEEAEGHNESDPNSR